MRKENINDEDKKNPQNPKKPINGGKNMKINAKKMKPQTVAIKPNAQGKKSFNLKESYNPIRMNEEAKKKKEKEEIEKNKIRNKLQCFICFGKVINAVMCVYCHQIACKECVKKMLSKNSVCINCKKNVEKDDMLELPFMDDLTSYFINKVENREIDRNIYEENNSKEANIKINDNKDNNNALQKNDKIQKCNNHPDRNVEYYCCNCNEYLCSECLIIFNKKSIDKHSNHIILENEKINEFNLNDIIKLYQSISFNKEKIYNKSYYYKRNIREIEIRKKRAKEIMEFISDELKNKYTHKINEYNSFLKILKQKKSDIEKRIKDFSYKFEKIREMPNDDEQKKLLSDLEQLNKINFDKDTIENKQDFQKDICCESYISELIELYIENGEYKEEANIIDKELNFINNSLCKLTAKLLFNSIVFTLVIEVNKEFYQKYHPIYYGDFVIISKKSCEYAIFSDYYSNGSLILSVEFPFSKMKPLLDDNNKCKIKINITKNYFK